MREAVLNLIDQKDYMRAVAGDEKYWKVCGAIFICGGTPFETTAGADVLLKGPNLEKAKALIKEAGYKGERIVLLSATDQSIVQNQALVTKERLGAAGLNIDLQANDWGTLITRRASKRSRPANSPPSWLMRASSSSTVMAGRPWRRPVS